MKSILSKPRTHRHLSPDNMTAHLHWTFKISNSCSLPISEIGLSLPQNDGLELWIRHNNSIKWILFSCHLWILQIAIHYRKKSGSIWALSVGRSKRTGHENIRSPAHLLSIEWLNAAVIKCQSVRTLKICPLPHALINFLFRLRWGRRWEIDCWLCVRSWQELPGKTVRNLAAGSLHLYAWYFHTTSLNSQRQVEKIPSL